MKVIHEGDNKHAWWVGVHLFCPDCDRGIELEEGDEGRIGFGRGTADTAFTLTIPCDICGAAMRYVRAKETKTTSDTEQYYDEHIAPRLKELGQECLEHGLSLLAVCEWEPGHHGRTAYMQAVRGLPINMANWAAISHGNVDAFWMTVHWYARKHGHSSSFLHLQGIPMKPDPE